MQRRYGELIPARSTRQTIRDIREYQLDILIRFGFDGLQYEALNLAKYGTWFYCHGDDRKMKRVAAGIFGGGRKLARDRFCPDCRRRKFLFQARIAAWLLFYLSHIAGPPQKLLLLGNDLFFAAAN